MAYLGEVSAHGVLSRFGIARTQSRDDGCVPTCSGRDVVLGRAEEPLDVVIAVPEQPDQLLDEFVAGAAIQQGMEGAVRRRVVDHLADENIESVQMLIIDTGMGDDADQTALEDLAHLDEVLHRLESVGGSRPQLVGQGRRHRPQGTVPDQGAVTVPDLYDSEGLQGAERFTDTVAAGIQRVHQLGFGGQSVAGSQSPIMNQRNDPFLHCRSTKPAHQRLRLSLGSTGAMVRPGVVENLHRLPVQQLFSEGVSTCTMDGRAMGGHESGMGNHLIDTTGPEFHGEGFTHAYIYGSWDGDVTFMEPVVTQEWFHGLVDGTRESARYGAKQPAAWKRPAVSHGLLSPVSRGQLTRRAQIPSKGAARVQAQRTSKVRL